MMLAIFVLLGLAIASIVFVLLVGWKVSDMLLHPRIFAYDTVVDEEVKRGHFTRQWFDETVHLEEFTLRSAFGYDLHCAVWPRKEGAAFADGRRRVVVLVHGFSYCLLGQIKYASLFHELGFDCVLYDHRNHGLSGKAPTTMGAMEAKDLSAVCAWARARYGAEALLGTHGESMGAATVMLHAKEDLSLAFAVEDCGFSSLKDEIAQFMRTRFHLPAFPFLPVASLFFRLRGGMFLGDVRPALALRDCGHVPMLFIHGDADELIPHKMMQTCFDAKSGEKECWLVPGGKHADCYKTDTEGYRRHLSSFLQKHGVIQTIPSPHL